MAKHILSSQELKRLADVIGEVERTTTGEIRMMIVKSSSATGHVHTLLWALMAALVFLGGWFLHPELLLLDSWWMWVGPAVLTVLYIVAGFLAHLHFLQRHLTSRHDLHHQVWTRAEIEFHREGLSHTHLHTGVLLFISQMERQAVVLADQGIASKVPPHTWDQVVQTMVRSGTWASKLEQAIRQCGEYLAAHFPPEGAKGNELPNDVIVKD